VRAAALAAQTREEPGADPRGTSAGDRVRVDRPLVMSDARAYSHASVTRFYSLLLIAGLSLWTFGCGAPGVGPRSAQSLSLDREAVSSLLDRLHDAAARADEEAYFGCYTEDAVFLGTDATEHWTLAEFREYSHPFFARGRAWTFQSTRRSIYFNAAGDLAWFDEDLATENLGPARGSGVLRRVGPADWQVVHYNLAITVPNDQFGAVRAVLSGN